MPGTLLRALLELISFEVGPVISLSLWMGKLRPRGADSGMVIPFYQYITLCCPLHNVGLDGNLRREAEFETPMNIDANSKPESWRFMDAEKVGTIG